MDDSEPPRDDMTRFGDQTLVPAPLSYLKSLRRKGDRQSLYQTIVLGGSFIEGLGMHWFTKTLNARGLNFHWKDSHPPIEMRHVLALLNGMDLLDDKVYGRFVQAAQFRNKVVHHMFSQWVEQQRELESMAEEIIECVSTIISGLQEEPSKSEIVKPEGTANKFDRAK